MRLDELFSRKHGVTIWTKSDGRLTMDRGIEGNGIRSAPVGNKLVARKKDEEESTK